MSPITRDIGRLRGPASSVSGTSLSNRVAMVWHRCKTKINRLLRNVPHESTRRFPYDIMEMIIAHLTNDLHALKACSLTCYSWYIAAAPHIHHTHTLCNGTRDESWRGLKSLSMLHRFGLASFVKEIRVKQRDPWFVPQAFSSRDLRYFSAFASVHTLELEGLEIHRFIPGIECYFGHLSPTLRSIRLRNPRCTPRQLSHFLSLFSNLDDINIAFPKPLFNTSIPGTELVPFSAPKLQGRLELRHFDWVETWTDLIASCGDLRFHHMDLNLVGGCAPVLFGACAETLETLRCSVIEIRSSPLEFDLSQLKVLRSLQVRDWATRSCIGNRHNIVTKALSTIASPVFSELVIVLESDDIYSLPSDVTLFETLRTMKEVRPFKTVFALDVLSPAQAEEGRRGLVGALVWADAEGLLNFLDPSPTISDSLSHSPWPKPARNETAELKDRSAI